MNKKIAIVILFIGVGLSALAQRDINNYKYVIIPLKYDFISENDQYRLNTLTRYLFKQEGFIALFDEEKFPEELNNDNCKALYANVNKIKGGLFATKLEIVLSNCFGKEVYKTEIGSSREKDYKKAYNEALKNAFKSIEELEYKYEAVEVKPIEKKVVKKDIVEVSDDVKPKSIEKKKEAKTNTLNNVKKDPYKAQLFGGLNYKLMNNKGELVYVLLYSGKENVYIVKGVDALVYKLNNNWVLAKSTDNKIEIESIEIKFD
ncbi:MAG: hypothetical protein N4A42_09980 [Winogradskyella sp.]|nr:hypothetical protein [Winogradskyella sp.]